MIKKDDVICLNDVVMEIIEIASENLEPKNPSNLVNTMYDKKIFL